QPVGCAISGRWCASPRRRRAGLGPRCRSATTSRCGRRGPRSHARQVEGGAVLYRTSRARLAHEGGRSRMKFLAITLITHVPDPITGIQKPTTERLRDVVDNAVLAEELGFDGYGVGERHERPFISSSPPVVLSHIAARTS